MVHAVLIIESDIPGDMTCAEYGRHIARPKSRRIKSLLRMIKRVVK